VGRHHCGRTIKPSLVSAYHSLRKDVGLFGAKGSGPLIPTPRIVAPDSVLLVLTLSALADGPRRFNEEQLGRAHESVRQPTSPAAGSDVLIIDRANRQHARQLDGRAVGMPRDL
jgi:hypothetical protein